MTWSRSADRLPARSRRTDPAQRVRPRGLRGEHSPSGGFRTFQHPTMDKDAVVSPYAGALARRVLRRPGATCAHSSGPRPAPRRRSPSPPSRTTSLPRPASPRTNARPAWRPGPGRTCLRGLLPDDRRPALPDRPQGLEPPARGGRGRATRVRRVHRAGRARHPGSSFSSRARCSRRAWRCASRPRAAAREVGPRRGRGRRRVGAAGGRIARARGGRPGLHRGPRDRRTPAEPSSGRRRWTCSTSPTRSGSRRPRAACPARVYRRRDRQRHRAARPGDARGAALGADRPVGAHQRLPRHSGGRPHRRPPTTRWWGGRHRAGGPPGRRTGLRVERGQHGATGPGLADRPRRWARMARATSRTRSASTSPWSSSSSPTPRSRQQSLVSSSGVCSWSRPRATGRIRRWVVRSRRTPPTGRDRTASPT